MDIKDRDLQSIQEVRDLVRKAKKAQKEFCKFNTQLIDEIDSTSWSIGGNTIDPEKDFVSFVNIKVSQGTTNADEMSKMLRETKKLCRVF